MKSLAPPRAGGLAAVAIAATFAAWQPQVAHAATVPSEPRAVQACAAPGEATVYWRAPRTNGGTALDRYRVTRSAAGIPAESFRLGPKKRSFTVVNLVAGTTYTFKVQAHNAEGWSPASKVAKVIPPVAGFGTLSGSCGLVAAQLTKPTPSLFESRLDFAADPFTDPDDLPLLTTGSQTLYAMPNSGGSTLRSELFAYETLARAAGASLVKSETEILYDQAGATTDMSVAIDGHKVGVSVTRAVDPPPAGIYTEEMAVAGLTAKLADIQESSANVSAGDAWVKQILVVMTATDANAETVKAALKTISPTTRGDTIVYLVVTDGADSPIYFNG